MEIRSTSTLLHRLGIRHPILQAPMAGGPATPALAAAVSNAGGLGFLAAGYLDPGRLREEIAATRRLTRRPFGVNAFVEGPTDGAADPEPMQAFLERWAREEGVDLPAGAIPTAAPGQRSHREMAEVVLEAGVPVFSVTFGVPDAACVVELRRAGVLVLGTATTVAEALLLQEAGVDAVVAQGAEAGAHRGSFLPPLEQGLVGTMALVPQVADALEIPVVAAGGIMDGRGIVAARALGAAAVQMGTAFLATPEARVTGAWRERLLAGREDETVVTRVVSGRPARAIRNRLISGLEASGVPIPPFPLQNSLTRAIRGSGAERGDAGLLSLWAGQGVRLARSLPAGELVRVLVEEARQVAQGLAPESAP